MPADRSEIDTTRQFRSVKEAVAVFGDRFLVPRPTTTVTIQETNPKPSPPLHQSREDEVVTIQETNPKPSPPSLHQSREDEVTLAISLKKLEAELAETKRELRILKERESETEIALASLNAELHRSMSKMAESEAVMAAEKAAVTKGIIVERVEFNGGDEKPRDSLVRFEHSPSLAQVLRLGEKEGYYGGMKMEKKVMKKKPIVPLIGDLFSRKKGSNNFTILSI